MITLSEGLGLFNSYKLSDRKAEPEMVPQLTVKETPTVDRVDPKELEVCYIFDAITFNSINKSTQAIMSAKYHLHAKDPVVFTYFTNFLNNIGKIGEDITFRELLYSTFQYQMIYGNAFIEIVWNKNMTKVTDLVVLDPKRIDYAKYGNNQIALDIYGKPIGYTQKVPYGVDITGKGDVPPKDVVISSDQIYIDAKRICHFKLFTYGDRFYGLGLIEPAYLSIKSKMNIEKAHADKATIPNPVIDYVGDEFHEPTPDMIDNAVEKMSQFKSNRNFAFPRWHNLVSLDMKDDSVYTDALKYLRENQSASLGVPLSLAAGIGEATNRSTLTNQQDFLEFTLNDIVEKTISTFRKFIFSVISETEGFSEVPTLYWENVATKSIGSKSLRLVEYVKSNILLPNEVHDYAFNSEGLSKIDQTENQDYENVKEIEEVSING